MTDKERKIQVEEDINLTSWATDVFLNSLGNVAPIPDKFKLGAHYTNNHPSGWIIVRINRLVNYYEEEVLVNKKFINRGYIDFVQRHWNDNLDMDCQLKDMTIKLQPEEIKNN